MVIVSRFQFIRQGAFLRRCWRVSDFVLSKRKLGDRATREGREFFENGVPAFQPKARPNHSAEQERIDYLEKKIQTKDEVLAELMAEHVALKKTLGEL